MRRTLALFVLLGACGDDGSAAPDADLTADAEAPRQSVAEDKLLLVGEIAEATLTGGPGDRAIITLTAPEAALDWNIHGHANGGSQTVKEELRVMSATYTFSPTAQADWSLLVRNQSTQPMTINIKVDLFHDMSWSGWQ
ncbi:MAG: hypothetical protein SFX73_25330 [Kofleriaceae bacterium]|nr:hypothetical protein [Kofleriaceae bacterium]